MQDQKYIAATSSFLDQNVFEAIATFKQNTRSIAHVNCDGSLRRKREISDVLDFSKWM